MKPQHRVLIAVGLFFCLFGVFLFFKPHHFLAKNLAPQDRSIASVQAEVLPPPVENLNALGTSQPGQHTSIGHNNLLKSLPKPPAKPLTDAEWVNRPLPSEGQKVSLSEGRDSVKRYLRAVQELEEKTSSRDVASPHRTVSEIYFMGIRMATDLTFAKQYVDEKELMSVSEDIKSKGFTIDRSTVFKVYPENEFFLTLGRNYGNKADVQFFENEVATSSQGLYKYQKPITEYYTCTQYGEGLLTDAYGAWTSYKKRFPRSPYLSEVNGRIDDIEKDFTENHCICGGEDTVKAELKKFVEVSPKSKLVGVLDSRLKNIKGNPDQEDFRFNYCKAIDAINYHP